MSDQTTDFQAIEKLERVDFDALDAIDHAGDMFRRQLKSLAQHVRAKRGGDSVTVADVEEACNRLTTTIDVEGLEQLEPRKQDWPNGMRL